MRERSGKLPVAQPEPAASAPQHRRDRGLPSLVGNQTMARVLSSPGMPLPDGVRDRFERTFGAIPNPAPVRAGVSDSAAADELQADQWAARALSSPDGNARADFSNVRVHTGPDAQASASELGANAYTVGENIVLGTQTPDARLLAHELTHVVQQSHSHEPAVQRDRAANCPAGAPATQKILTTQDFIAVVQRVETDNPSIASDPIAIARLIARTKYAGSMWDWLLPTTAGQAGVQTGTSTSVTADDLGGLCFKLIVTMPGGGQEDPMHLIAAIVANAETKAAGTVSPGLTVFASAIPSTLSQRRFATWAGDAGAAAGNWVYWGPTTTKPAKDDYMKEDAPPHDMMADVDGVAMVSTSAASGFAFDRTASLSSNLQRFFLPTTPRTARFRRFHIFCSVEGFALEADGVTLSAAAKTTIRDRVNDFATWFLANNPTIVANRALTTPPPPSIMAGPGGGMAFGAALANAQAANARVTRLADIPWFADQFIAFVQTGLTAEGP